MAGPSLQSWGGEGGGGPPGAWSVCRLALLDVSESRGEAHFPDQLLCTRLPAVATGHPQHFSPGLVSPPCPAPRRGGLLSSRGSVPTSSADAARPGACWRTARALPGPRWGPLGGVPRGAWMPWPVPACLRREGDVVSFVLHPAKSYTYSALALYLHGQFIYTVALWV